MQKNGFGFHQFSQLAHDRGAVAAHPKECFMAIAGEGNRETVHVDNFHHPAARGDGPKKVLLASVAQGEPIGVRVFVAGIHNGDADLHAGVAQRLRRPGEPLIGGVPAHQSAEQAHVRALAFVRRGQRALAVELDQNLLEVGVHQVAGQPPNAQGGGAVGTRWPAHDGANDIVKDTDDHSGQCCQALSA